jgi:hypothetical protein
VTAARVLPRMATLRQAGNHGFAGPTARLERVSVDSRIDLARREVRSARLRCGQGDQGQDALVSTSNCLSDEQIIPEQRLGLLLRTATASLMPRKTALTSSDWVGFGTPNARCAFDRLAIRRCSVAVLDISAWAARYDAIRSSVAGT